MLFNVITFFQILGSELAENPDLEEYGSFLLETNSTFYNSPKYIQMIQKLTNAQFQMISIRKNKELVGVFPYFIKKSDFGSVINSLPYFGSYGGIIAEDLESKKMIIKEVNELKNKKDLLSLVIIENPFDIDNELYQKYLEYDFIDKRLTQCTPLEKYDTNIRDKFEKRVRWSIRKAENNNIIVEKKQLDSEIIEDLFYHHKKNMENKNAEFKQLEFFNFIKNHFTSSKDYDLFIGKKDNLPIAYLLIFYYKEFAEYYLPVQNIKFRDLQASSKLILESMKVAIDRQIKFYNFGGTPKTNQTLYKFKNGWNAVDFEYKYYVSANIERIRTTDINKLKDKFQNFYVVPYSEIKNG